MTGCEKCNSGTIPFWIVQWNSQDVNGRAVLREARLFDYEQANAKAKEKEGIVAYEIIAACSCPAGQHRTKASYGGKYRMWAYEDLKRDIEGETKAS